MIASPTVLKQTGGSQMRRTRLFIIIGALLGAVICYLAGFTLGLTAFLVAGAVLEMAFWIAALTGGARGVQPL